MAIQNRRGAYVDFDPTKMVAGEFAVVQSGDENTDDGKALYVAPTTGSVKRIPFADELEGLVEVDDTLTEAGAAADAKKTGDEITALKDDFEQFVPGLSGAAKAALLECFSHVVWNSDQGMTYYEALETALNEGRELDHLTAIFDSGGDYIFTDDPIDSVRQYITCLAYYNDGAILEIDDYVISGTLIEGTSVLTISYRNKVTSVSIENVHDFYNTWEWVYVVDGPSNLISAHRGTYDLTIDDSKKGVFCNEGIANARRGFFTDRGVAQVQLADSKADSGFYPVPIPATATKITATLADSTQQLSVYLWEYINDSTLTQYHYRLVESNTWNTGSNTMSFNAGAGKFVSFNTRQAATGGFNTEPEITVLFE